MFKGKNIKRILAVLMMALMMISFMPTMGVFADETVSNDTVPASESVENTTTPAENSGEEQSTPPAEGSEEGKQEAAEETKEDSGEAATDTANETSTTGAEEVAPTNPEEPASEGTDAIKVYITISKDGEVVEDRNGEKVAVVPVELLGKKEYTLDDVFKSAHGQYHKDGEEAYGTAESQWGLGVSKLWGIENGGNYGYQINNGEVMVMGPTQAVNDGDIVDAYVIKNNYPDTEAYATFNQPIVIVEKGESINYKLVSATYDENFNMVFVPVEGATIYSDGDKMDWVTDANGLMWIKYNEEGEHIITATKTKELNGEVVPAITAAVSRVIVKAKEEPAKEETEVYPPIPGCEESETKTETKPAETKEDTKATDTKANTNSGAASGTATKATGSATGVPKTGDNENMGAFMVLGLGAALVLVATKRIKSR